MDKFKDIKDEEIIEEVRSKNQEIYSIIIKRYQNKLLRYAMSIVKDEHLATDIVQESFIKAFINIKGFNIKKKFSSWIYRIVHNESINILNKTRKEIPFPENIEIESDENIEKDFEEKEIIENVRNCLNSLPTIYSEILFLRFIENKNYEEISDILKIPMGTVAIRINRAKSIMKKICQKR